MKPKDRKLVDKVVNTLLDYQSKGITLKVDYVPSIIKANFGVEPHIFYLAVNELRHRTKVILERNGSYRQASKAHDYRPDTYIIPAGEETLWLSYSEHMFGRNGAPKRKCSQWRESVKTS